MNPSKELKTIAGDLNKTSAVDKESGRPPKRSIDKLVQAFAAKIDSDRAHPSIAQRKHDQFNKLLRSMQDKYPDVDMESRSFWSTLENSARKYLRTKAVRGPGGAF